MGDYSIRERKDGRIEIRVTINGKQKSIYLPKDKNKIVFSKKEEKQKDMLFGTWVDKWKELYKRPNVSQKTMDSINTVYKTHILPKLSYIKISEISIDMVQELINGLKNKPRTQTITFIYLNECLQRALYNDLISKNPCKYIEYKKVPTNKRRALTYEEQKQFIDYLEESKHPLKNLFLFYICTGVRRNEALTITQKDIDRKQNKIHIKGTKTKGSDRVIDTTSQIIGLLGNNSKPFDYLPNFVTKSFNRIMKALKIEGICLNCLRHTFATRCLENGVDLKTIQKWLGHSTYNLTANTYTHIQSEFMSKETKLLEGFTNDILP